MAGSPVAGAVRDQAPADAAPSPGPPCPWSGPACADPRARRAARARPAPEGSCNHTCAVRTVPSGGRPRDDSGVRQGVTGSVEVSRCAASGLRWVHCQKTGDPRNPGAAGPAAHAWHLASYRHLAQPSSSASRGSAESPLRRKARHAAAVKLCQPGGPRNPRCAVRARHAAAVKDRACQRRERWAPARRAVPRPPKWQAIRGVRVRQRVQSVADWT